MNNARRWVDTFQPAFPEATWVAIGLTRMPDDLDAWVELGLELELDAWVELGLELELDDALTTRTLPRQAPPPEGYAVRRLSGQDWAQSVARSVAANDRTQDEDPQS